jgi:sporulation protein YlmC with PRC-barrel domain
MRATDLLGLRVYTHDGMRIGTVRDLHIEKRPQPYGDSGDPAYQVSAVECGAVGVAHRLGYTRGSITGPWPLHTLLAWFSRRSWSVPWEDIKTIRADHIVLGVDRHQLQHLGQEQA